MGSRGVMGASGRILLADDEADLRCVLVKRLESWGYAVVAAADGLEALRLALAEPPDLLLLDIMMPGLNGVDAARQLKRAPATARVPIIFITAKGKPLTPKDAEALGVYAIVYKPYETDDLRRLIQAAIGSST